MFALRGIAISLSMFFMVYVALSGAVCLVWRRVRICGQRHSVKRCADVLFAIRTVPFAVATGVTVTFALPSFLLLEPRFVNEPIGHISTVLGFCGMAVILAGMLKAVAAVLQASQSTARWSGEATVIGSARIESTSSVPVLRSAAAPPLTTAGILRPRVWLSQGAESVLTQSELQSALRHEVAHVRCRDNLRKLILRLVAFPGMAALENAWHEATEMAADDAAVSSASEALDLAAAVIKLSRLSTLQPSAALTTALVRSPSESVNARVQRLIAWTERRQSSVPRYSLARSVFGAVAVVITLVVTYSHLLTRVHAATEWLVR